VERWVSAISNAPNPIRLQQTFFETLDRKFRNRKRGVARRQHPTPASDNEPARRRVDRPEVH
jgi:hypothetical protein